MGILLALGEWLLIRRAKEVSIFFRDNSSLGLFLASTMDSLTDSSSLRSRLIYFLRLWPFSVIVMHIGRACLLKVLFIYLLLNSLFETPSLYFASLLSSSSRYFYPSSQLSYSDSLSPMCSSPASVLSLSLQSHHSSLFSI